MFNRKKAHRMKIHLPELERSGKKRKKMRQKKLKTYKRTPVFTENVHIPNYQKIWRYGFIFLLFTVTCFLFFFLFFSNYFRIKDVQVIREALLTDSSQVEESI